MDSGTTPSEATKAEEAAEAQAEHSAGRAATEEEAAAAPDHASPETEKAYKEMTERGAGVKGEGQIP